MMPVKPMALPDLSGLPEWAQWVVYGVLAVSIGLGWAVARLGLFKGRETPAEARQDTASVAAVIVNPEALNRLTATAEALNITLMEMKGIVREVGSSSMAQARAQRASTKALEAISKSVDGLAEAADKLTDEVIRSGRAG